MQLIDKLLESAGKGPLQIALCATNGRCFAATGINFPIRYLAVEGISDCPVCHARNDAGRNGRRIPHESLRALVIEADRDVASRPGWRDVDDRTALDRRPRRGPYPLAALRHRRDHIAAIGGVGAAGERGRRR